MKQQYVINVISGLIQAMPLNENEIASIVKDLVDREYVPTSAPPSTTNYFLQQALFDLNKQIRRIE